MPILTLGSQRNVYRRPRAPVRRAHPMGDLILKSGQSNPLIPIFNLKMNPGDSDILSKWKKDYTTDWKAQFDSTYPIYGKGLVDGGGFNTWEEAFAHLSGPDRAKFVHPKGEVTPEWIAKWKANWEATVQLNSQGVPVDSSGGWVAWYRVFGKDRDDYLRAQAQGMLNAQIIQGDTLYEQAQRAAGKLSLDTYADLIKRYGSKINSSEREFLSYFFVEWQKPKSEADVAKAQAILNRIGYVAAPKEENIQALYDTYIAAGGDPAEWEKIMANAKKSSTEYVISNGGGNGITATDWNNVQANQKVVTAMKDSTMISPLQTMFLNPDTKQRTAAEASAIDLASVSSQAAASMNEVKQISPLTWLGIAVVALKLFGR